MRTPLWFVLPLFLGQACGEKDPVLAQVGPHSVTAADFKKEIAGVPFTSQTYLRTPAGRKELLELLVRRKIILAEVESKPRDSETKMLLSDLGEQFKEQKKRLRERYFEERERLLVGQYTKTLKNGPLKISDADVRSFWETEKEVRAAHILVSDRTLAENIRKKIAAGEKFDALAKAHSEDTPSAEKGGDAGYLLPGSLVPEFETALFSMKKGDTSDVVVSPYGFHIIRRGDERPLSARPLDDAMKTRLRQALESRKLHKWFETIRQRHSVQVNNEHLQDIVFPSTTDSAPLEKKPEPR
ncbi:MAG: peptidylprolyl isomerase [Elusimicrobia bacterium]|nr:peptidylprolyl isomerase [Elusimicrobiota bacterium]